MRSTRRARCASTRFPPIPTTTRRLRARESRVPSYYLLRPDGHVGLCGVAPRRRDDRAIPEGASPHHGRRSAHDRGARTPVRRCGRSTSRRAACARSSRPRLPTTSRRAPAIPMRCSTCSGRSARCGDGATVADIGAGTGLLTQGLFDARIPDDRRRAQSRDARGLRLSLRHVRRLSQHGGLCRVDSARRRLRRPRHGCPGVSLVRSGARARGVPAGSRPARKSGADLERPRGERSAARRARSGLRGVRRSEAVGARRARRPLRRAAILWRRARRGARRGRTSIASARKDSRASPSPARTCRTAPRPTARQRPCNCAASSTAFRRDAAVTVQIPDDPDFGRPESPCTSS